MIGYFWSAFHDQAAPPAEAIGPAHPGVQEATGNAAHRPFAGCHFADQSDPRLPWLTLGTYVLKKSLPSVSIGFLLRGRAGYASGDNQRSQCVSVFIDYQWASRHAPQPLSAGSLPDDSDATGSWNAGAWVTPSCRVGSNAAFQAPPVAGHWASRVSSHPWI